MPAIQSEALLQTHQVRGKKKMDRIRLSLFVPILLTAMLANARVIRNGEDVLGAMHDRYKDSWYSTVTFTQKSTTYNADGTNKVETWYEAAMLPGKLRI